MKILYVSTILEMVESFLIPHINFLVNQGHRVDIACNLEGDMRPEALDSRVKIHPIPFQRSPVKLENMRAYRKIKKLVQKEGYNLVHTHTPMASVLTRLACRYSPNTKVIYTVHGFHFFKGAPLKNWVLYYTVEKLMARWTDVLITMNEEDYRRAQTMALRNGGPVYQVPGVGMDTNRFSPPGASKKQALREEYGYGQDAFILIYPAELSYRKHQDLLIEGVALLKDQVPNIKLLLPGHGDLSKQYQSQVMALGLDDYIEFLGYRRDIDNLMMLADVAVSSSRQEGLPVNVMEAMTTGLPLVVTDCRGNRDLVRDGENGFVVGINETEAFVEAIKSLYHDEALRVALGRRGLERIGGYTLDVVIEQLSEVYGHIFGDDLEEDR